MSHERYTEMLVRQALAEDLGDPPRDITSEALIPHDLKTTAVLRNRKPGIISGIELAAAAFRLTNPALAVKDNVVNGDKVSSTTDLLTVSGSAISILRAERVALNFLCHLSGIATLTNRYIVAIKGTKAKILDTRKTTPGLRMLEKSAVAAGGGQNHRFGLYDAILIKDNHISVAKSIKVAIDKAKAANPGKKIEIEVDTLAQLQEVLDHGGADIVLLDNMDLPTLKQAAALTKKHNAAFPAKPGILLEASGGVTLETVRAIAETGVDYISVGALTHSAPALDIGLDIDL